MPAAGPPQKHPAHNQRLPGPCDVPNVALIATADENIWLGNLDRDEYYREIVEWAVRSKAAGRMLPLSKELLRHRLNPSR
jgi:hypothetical protein